MKSKKDTKIDFSAASNTFLISHGKETRVRCLCCKQECQKIELPEFTMYFCNFIFCLNTLELRQTRKGKWELHDYGSGIASLVDYGPIDQLLSQPKKKFIPQIVK